jgi:alcohol dehydrogenase
VPRHHVDRLCRRRSGHIRIGDTVAVFAQGPIGLCATAGAKLRGAAQIIAVDGVPERLAMARPGRRPRVDFRKDRSGRGDHAADRRPRRRRGDRGARHAGHVRGCLRVLRPGGTLSSLGVYSGDLKIPLGAFAAGLGDHKIVTSLCPGGKERMRRLMKVIESGRVDRSRPLVTHRFKLDDIEEAYDLFSNQRDGVLKIAITP